jgi:hypothetical protein
VDYILVEPAVHKETAEAFGERDHGIVQIKASLVYYNIPQSLSAIVEVGAMKQHVLVYFTITKVRYPAVFHNGFWRTEFGWKICNDGEVSEIHDGKWDENGD